MERQNRLSDNLKAYKIEQNKTLSELSKEFDVARSTMQSILVDGNTTVHTAVHMANAKGVTLDELVFGKLDPNYPHPVACLLKGIEWYAKLSMEEQAKARYHLVELIKLACRDGGGESE